MAKKKKAGAGKPNNGTSAAARLVYFISQFECDEHGWIPCIAREGEQGFYRSDWRWKCDLETARGPAAEKNAALGIDDREAARIQATTLRQKA
jgi:hypothetical protein